MASQVPVDAAQQQQQQAQPQQAAQQSVGGPAETATQQQQPQQQAVAPQPVASLYVGDLAPDVQEHDLYSVFSTAGSIVSVRVCRDQITRASLGYGYVNFSSNTDAEKALNELNFHVLNGRPIRVAWSQRDPSQRRSGAGNIFISNLPEDTTGLHLRDTFEQFGKIASCKAVIDPRTSKCRGFGFVHFVDPKVAETAIREANGTMVGGRKLYVAPFKPRRTREAEAAEKAKNFTNVYVKSLRRGVDEEELLALFSGYGKVTSYAIKNFQDNEGNPLPFGFVNFDDTGAAQACTQETELHQRDIVYLNDMAFDGSSDELLNEFKKHGEIQKNFLKTGEGKANGFVLYKENESVDKCLQDMGDKVTTAKLYVQRAMKKRERNVVLRRKLQEKRRVRREKGGNLYVKYLADSVTEDQLRGFFEPYGHVTSVRIARNPDGTSRGFGYVSFSTRDEAEQAMVKRNRQPLAERPIYVAFHQTREERANARALRQQQRQMMYATAPFPGMGPMGPFNAPYSFPPQMMMMNPQMAMRQPYPQQPMRVMQGRGVQQAGGRMQGAQPVGRQGGVPRGNFPMQQGQQQGAPQQMPGQQQPQMVPGQQQRMSGAQGYQQTDLSSQLAQMSNDERRRYLGDMLYHKVHAMDSTRAPKITGMLLEYEPAAILNLLENDTSLREHVNLAQNVLENKPQAVQPSA